MMSDEQGRLISAAEGSSVLVGGDVVARDKIVYGNENLEASTAVYLTAIRNEFRSLPWSPFPRSNDPFRKIDITRVFLDVPTDALRPATAVDGASRFSVLDALRGMPTALISGSSGSGKTTALRYLARTLAEQQQPAPIPIVLDAADTFGAWLNDSQRQRSPGDLEDFLHDIWGIQLSEIRQATLATAFLWDHLYLLSSDARRNAITLVRAIRRWMPSSRHAVTMRNLALPGLDDLDDFDTARILPLSRAVELDVITQYEREGQIPLRTPDPSRKAHASFRDALYAATSTNRRSLLVEFSRQFQKHGIVRSSAEDIANNLPEMCWRLLASRSEGLTFFEISDLLAAGDRFEMEAVTVAFDLLLEQQFLVECEDSTFRSSDDSFTRSIAVARAPRSTAVRQSLLAGSEHGSILLDVLEELPRSAEASDLITELAEQLFDPAFIHDHDVQNLLWEDEARLRLGLAALEGGDGNTFGAALGAACERIEISVSHQLPLRTADELKHLVSRVERATLHADKGKVGLKRIGPGNSRVSLPTGNASERNESEVAITYPVWFFQTPISNLVFNNLRPLIADPSVLEDVSTARPEVWVCGSDAVLELVPDYASDPVVGVTFTGALAICRALSTTVSEHLGLSVDVDLPYLGEWGLLDDGLLEGSSVNNRQRKGGLNRPTAIGVSGWNRSEFSDVYGNVMEWTLTSWGSTALDQPGHTEPYALGNSWDTDQVGFRLLRGGSWLFEESGPKCACVLPPSASFPDVSLRPLIRDHADEINFELGTIEIAI